MTSTYWLHHKFLIITLALFALACTPTPQAEGFSLSGFQNLFGNAYPITYVTKSGESATTILIEYTFNKTDEAQHYIIEIQLSKPGSLVLESEYLAQYQASQTENNPQKHTTMFPPIGHNAQYTFLGAGPGGSAEQLLFTSSNRHYDVKIISSHLLPDNVSAPTLTLETLAAYIDKTLTNIQYIKE